MTPPTIPPMGRDLDDDVVGFKVIGWVGLVVVGKFTVDFNQQKYIDEDTVIGVDVLDAVNAFCATVRLVVKCGL